MKRNRRTPRSMHAPYRQAGSVYIAVLGVSMLVTLLGVSMLMAARLQRRVDAGASDVAQARLIAQSGIEIALQTLAGNPRWRYTMQNDQWPAAMTELGGGRFRYKVKLLSGASFWADMSSDVLVTAEGYYGSAKRTFSVQLKAAGAPPMENLLTNSANNFDFEANVGTPPVSSSSGGGGIPGWRARRPTVLVSGVTTTATTLTIRNDDAPQGNQYMLVDRTSAASSSDRATTEITAYSGLRYRAGLWLKSNTGGNMNFRIFVNQTGSGNPDPAMSATFTVGTTWTWVERDLSVMTFTGLTSSAHFYLDTPGSNGDYSMDGCTLVTLVSAPMKPIPGTWRQAQ